MGSAAIQPKRISSFRQRSSEKDSDKRAHLRARSQREKSTTKCPPRDFHRHVRRESSHIRLCGMTAQAMPADSPHPAMGRKILRYQYVTWLGRQDSNLGMAESKSAALPLGYAPAVPQSSRADHTGAGAADQRGRMRALDGLSERACEPSGPPLYSGSHWRSVAQPGSAPRSGRGGRRFKSCHSDQTSSDQRYSCRQLRRQ